MINDTSIPEGSLVYVCRRGLEARYVGQMVIEVHHVVKRTPSGYKLDFEVGHKGERLYKDADYYISTDRQAVARAVKDNLRAEIVRADALMERLKAKEAQLNGIIYE